MNFLGLFHRPLGKTIHQNVVLSHQALRPNAEIQDDEHAPERMNKDKVLIHWNQERQLWRKQAADLNAQIDRISQEKENLEDGLLQAKQRWQQKLEKQQFLYEQLKDIWYQQLVELETKNSLLETELKNHIDHAARQRQVLEEEIRYLTAELMHLMPKPKIPSS